ncbi:MAG: TPM domain-containing protein [Coriobacteriales bacterium]|nr:TPM domain-containing protein [Coriobacteriales bacterium]
MTEMRQTAFMRRVTTTVLLALIVIVIVCNPNLAFASTFTPVQRTLPLVVDNAGLLNDHEKQDLITLFERLSEEQHCEIAVVTIQSLNGRSVMDYADDFFDYNGYGWGPDDDGILLLVSMSEREWWVTTHGRAFYQLTEDRFDWLMADVLPKLSDGFYYQAFKTFGENSAELMQMSEPKGELWNPENQTPNQTPNESNLSLVYILVCLVTSLVGGAAVSGGMTAFKSGKHKSVIFQQGAQAYLKNIQSIEGSTTNQDALPFAGRLSSTAILDLSKVLLLHSMSDTFLRKSVSTTKRVKASSNSGGGGFGGHTSSSGRTHGGGGGRF